MLDSLEALAIKATQNGVTPKYETTADKVARLPKLPSFSNDTSKADRRATRLMNRGRPLPQIPPGASASIPSGEGAAGARADAPGPTKGGATTSAPNHAPSAAPSLLGALPPTPGAAPSTPLPNAPSNLGPPTATRTIHAASHAPRLETELLGSGAPKGPLPSSPRQKMPSIIENCVTRLASAARGRIARRIQQKRVTDIAYRARVAQEILSTEMQYVQLLLLLKRMFLDPLMQSQQTTKPILPLDDVKAIFSSLEVICAYNTDLLEQLKPRVQDWSPQQRLGDIFLQICGFLKVYTNYVANYNLSIHTLNRCRTKKDKFAQWLAEKEAANELNGLKLGALLILPVQRIPRYQLLLSNLSEHTWESHADYQDLRKATVAIQEVAIYLNDKKRLADNIAKVSEIQDQFIWDEDLALPHRLFVKEFTLRTLFPGKDRELKDRKFYFFNDLLIVTKSHRAPTLSPMQFLGKGGDKGKEKVVSSHPLECVHFVACTSSPTGVTNTLNPNECTFIEIKDLGSGSMLNDKLTTLYWIESGTTSIREEILTIFHQYAAERRAARGSSPSPGVSGATSPASSRPSSLRPDKEDSSESSSDKSKDKSGAGSGENGSKSGNAPASSDSNRNSTNSSSASADGDGSKMTSSEREKNEKEKEKRKLRSSRGKQELQALHTRSTLHGDPTRRQPSGSGSTVNLSASTSAAIPPFQRSSTNTEDLMPQTLLSPRTSVSSNEASSESTGTNAPGNRQSDPHHDPIAGALSPRLAPADSPDSAQRRASFKRSNTERPVVPPKPDRLRSGQAPPPAINSSAQSGLLFGSTKPSAPPPSLPLPSVPSSAGANSTASPRLPSHPPVPLVVTSPPSARTTSAPNSSAPSPDMAQAASAADNAVHPSGASTPAPMKRADTTNSTLLRRQSAFKSKTLAGTTNDLPMPTPEVVAAAAAQNVAYSRASISSGNQQSTTNNNSLCPPTPTNDPAASASAGLQNATAGEHSSSSSSSSHSRGSSNDDTNVGGSGSNSSLNRPTRQAPSPRASVVNHNHVPPPSATTGK